MSSRHDSIEMWWKVMPELGKFLSSHHQTEITEAQIFEAIMLLNGDTYQLEYKGNLWGVMPDLELLKTQLANFDFSVLDNRIEIDEELIPLELRFFTKAFIKNDGKKWIIHRNDADPFPSKPHAHLTETNLKLHLGNGDLFQIKQLKGAIRKKELIEIRQKAENLGFEMPNLSI